MKSQSNNLPELLQHFRTNHTLQSVQVDKHQWQYYTAGNPNAEALLLLHGGGGNAETMFLYIIGFAENFHVIAPNIPHTLKTMDEAADGLAVVLQHEHIKQAHVVGMSFGAVVAQMFIRRFRHMVLDMVITHTVIPSDHLAERVAMQRNLMRLYPAPLLSWMMRRSFRQNIANSVTKSSPDVRRFWQKYFDNLYRGQLRKRDILSRVCLTLNYHRANQFKSNDLNDWYGDLLIIQSDEDEVIGAGDRGALLGMYPRAYVQTLEGYDHLTPLLATDEMLSSITNFLLRPDD